MFEDLTARAGAALLSVLWPSLPSARQWRLHLRAAPIAADRRHQIIGMQVIATFYSYVVTIHFRDSAILGHHGVQFESGDDVSLVRIGGPGLVWRRRNLEANRRDGRLVWRGAVDLLVLHFDGASVASAC